MIHNVFVACVLRTIVRNQNAAARIPGLAAVTSGGVELATTLTPDTLLGFPNFWTTPRTESMPKRTFVDVKTALAEKYERLSRLTSCTPKRSTFAFMALKYRRQAEQAARDGHS